MNYKKQIEEAVDKIVEMNQGRMGGPKAAGPGGVCVCPECGEKVEHKTGEPCTDAICPKCETKMVRESKSVKESKKIELHPFNKEDWAAYAGAEMRSNDREPLTGVMSVDGRESDVIVDKLGIAVLQDSENGFNEFVKRMDSDEAVKFVSLMMKSEMTSEELDDLSFA